MKLTGVVFALLCATIHAQDKTKKQTSDLDQILERLSQQEASERQSSQPAGSLWSPAAQFSDLAADLRARHVGDIVTILVAEKASAVSSGTVKSARNSSVQSQITAAGGITRALGPLANLAGAGTTSSLDGQGTTTRDTSLTATVSAFVTRVLPNGDLVIEGAKNVRVNAENQVIGVRGVIRPIDLSNANVISSDRVADMEIQVNGKGVVGDSVRRPFILYRLILGLLPF
jgi:flagellar L-ring protein FlgH